jgi:hypothetical protein
MDVVSSFTMQLLSQLPHIPSDIEASYTQLKTESPTYKTLEGFLFSMPERFASNGNRVFIACDALDETDEYTQRQELLPLFHKMKQAGFDIFLTSRPHPADVRISFAEALQLELIPHPNDLHGYVRDRILANLNTRHLLENSATLQFEDLVSVLIASADKMYEPDPLGGFATSLGQVELAMKRKRFG